MSRVSGKVVLSDELNCAAPIGRICSVIPSCFRSCQTHEAGRLGQGVGPNFIGQRSSGTGTDINYPIISAQRSHTWNYFKQGMIARTV